LTHTIYVHNRFALFPSYVSSAEHPFLPLQAVLFHPFFSQPQMIRSQSPFLASFLLNIFCYYISWSSNDEGDVPSSTTSATKILPKLPMIDAKSSFTGCSNRSRLSYISVFPAEKVQGAYLCYCCFWDTCYYECIVSFSLICITHFPQITDISICSRELK
jgi:hypothetical protein